MTNKGSNISEYIRYARWKMILPLDVTKALLNAAIFTEDLTQDGYNHRGRRYYLDVPVSDEWRQNVPVNGEWSSLRTHVQRQQKEAGKRLRPSDPYSNCIALVPFSNSPPGACFQPVQFALTMTQIESRLRELLPEAAENFWKHVEY